MWGSICEDIRTTCTYITNITHPSLTLTTHSQFTHTHSTHTPLTHNSLTHSTYTPLTLTPHSQFTHTHSTHLHSHSPFTHSTHTPYSHTLHLRTFHLHSPLTHTMLTLTPHSLLTSPLQGYLFVSVIFGENHDLMPLVIQAIRLDLQSPNSVFKTLAMQCVANIGSKQMAAQIGPEIPVLLTAR